MIYYDTDGRLQGSTTFQLSVSIVRNLNGILQGGVHDISFTGSNEETTPNTVASRTFTSNYVFSLKNYTGEFLRGEKVVQKINNVEQ